MKKQLFLSVALLGAVGLMAQSSFTGLKPVKSRNIKQEKQAYLKLSEQDAPVALNKPSGTANNPVQNLSAQEKAAAISSSTINWQLLCGSMNVYGQLVSQSRPLQYNDNVNAISVIHRKSATYTASPAADSNPGTIVAEISGNWGTNFDSTCLYANVDAGRYPQGAIYAGPGNSDLANAYVVGSGPTVNNNAFTGNWYASKKLATPGSTLYNNAGDATPGAQQFIAFSAPNMQNHSWSRYGFSSTDDGAVRSLALLENDPTTLGDMTGVAVVKGTFNAGTFSWAVDVLTPSCAIGSDGTQQMFSAPQMAWNESGTVGYVVIPGVLNTATGSNRGYQHIIYKTTNSGASWALANGVDYNAPTMTVVLQHIASTSNNPTLAIPAVFGDYDITVDKDNKLHIGTLLMSSFWGGNDDSTGFVSSFDNSGEFYNWGHVPGFRPYLFDFIGDGTGSWDVVIVDSLSSEGPSSNPAGNGYNDNPWDPTGTGSAKIEVDPRIQLGRTPDGEYITFSWVESDTNYTSSAKKWNNLPDIKSRLMSVGSGTNMYKVSPTEINVTQYPASVGAANPQVITRATLHYMSPTTGSATVVDCPDRKEVSIKTPFTITNSNPYSQLTNNTTWFSAANLYYVFGNGAPCGVGIGEGSIETIDALSIYPNPAAGNAKLELSSLVNEKTQVDIFSILGQNVQHLEMKSQIGINTYNLDLSGFKSGVYVVKVKSGNSELTRKLIIE